MSKPNAEQTELARVSALLRGEVKPVAGDDGSDAGSSEGESGRDAETMSYGTDSEAIQPVGDVADAPEVDAETSDLGGDVTSGVSDSAITVKDIAEKLGVDPADLYDGLEIPLGDGERVTLGEWKDRVKALQAVDVERDQVETQRQQYERDVARTRAELNQIVQMIPEQAREQLLARARQNQAQYEKEQWEAVVTAIPKWKESPESFAADRASIVKIGAEYGFSEPEITYTQDARAVRLLHDFLRLRERIEKQNVSAKQTAAQINRSAKGKTRSSSRRLAEAIRGAKESKDLRSKEAVVAELIRSQ